MACVFEMYHANFASQLFIIPKWDSCEILFFRLDQNSLQLSNLKTKKAMSAKFSVVITQVKAVICSVS